MFLFPLYFGTSSTAQTADRIYCLNVNYSAVPAMVNSRKLTLNVNVGTCSSVSVTADGSSVPVTYTSGTGMALFTTTGSAIQVTAVNWTAGGTGAATKTTLFNNYKWAFSLTLDDGLQSQVTNAKPLLDAKGWKAGAAIVGNWANTGGANNYMSWATVQSLRTAGWEIYNHSYTHPNPLNCANFMTELDQNETQFNTRLPGYNVNHIVFPYEVSGATGCGGFPPAYLISGEVSGGLNFVDAALPNVFLAGRSGLYGTDSSALQTMAAGAAGNARPAWMIVITHGVSAGGGAPPDAYATNANTLNTLFNYLDTNFGTPGNRSMWFSPSGEVMDYIFTRDRAVVTTCAVASTSTPTRTNTPMVLTSTPTRTSSSTSTRTATSTFVPATSTLTASPSSTATRTSTLTRTSTASSTLTRTATSTSTPMANTSTATSTPSRTLTATSSNTPLAATSTSTPTQTSTRSMTPTATLTLTRTATQTPTFTLSNTLTATPSSTPSGVPTFTQTSSPTSTNTPVASTPTPTPTQTSSATRTSSPSMTPTATLTLTRTATQTPTFTLSNTLTATPSSTPSGVPTFTQTSSLTSTPTGQPTNTSSATATSSPTQVNTLTATASSTRTSTLSPTFTPSNIPTFTQTLTSSATSTLTATPSSTATRSATSTLSATSTRTNTLVSTATPSPSRTPTSSPTFTPSNVPTFTQTLTPSPTASLTLTATMVPTASATVTSTLTATPTVPAGVTPVLSSNPADESPIDVLPQAYTGTSNVTIQIYSNGMRLVKTKDYGVMSLGWVTLELTDDSGQPLAGALYYVRVTTKVGTSTVKLLILR